MSFWAWAVAAYGRPGAAEACLDLQDRHGQSVPFLLWAVWAAAEGRPLAPDRLAEGAALAARWEALAVGPLRTVRCALKAPAEGVADAAREALRAQVKAVELAAERVLIDALEALAPAAGPPALAFGPALLAAARAWGGGAPEAALRGLAQTLS